MRKYPKYKRSGVDWLGEIPNDWNSNRLASFGRFSKGSGISKSNLVEQGIPVILYGDIYTKYNLRTNKIINYISKELASVSKLIVNGDILFTGSGETREDIGKCIVYFGNEEVYAGGDTIIFSPKSNDSLFLAYSLNSNFVVNKKAMDSKGDIIVHIYASTLRNISIPIPSLPEQHAIVHFLDYKTGQIDSFIANRQKQIELLKEQKAGIINKAVTKGINPNAKMKDSGIDWIGEVPKHWMIGKVRRVLNILTDFTANGSFADLAKNVKYLDTPDHSRLIRLTDLREDLKNEGIYVNKEAHKFLSKSELFGGEILMANVGAYAGLVCLVPKLDFVATLGPNMFLLKFEEKRMSNQFAFTLLGSDCYYKLLMNKALSSAQPKLNKEDVKSIDFIFPPTQEEQKAILDWIKEETSNVDTLISKYQKQIDLMQEYRTSLISQAVTGKIDVREWQPKKQQTA